MSARFIARVSVRGIVLFTPAVLLASWLLLTALSIPITAQATPFNLAADPSAGGPHPTPTPQPITLTRIEPNQGAAGAPNEATVFGANLQQDMSITIGGVPVHKPNAGRTDGTELDVIVPAGIAPGVHDVVASIANQAVFTLTGGYMVVEELGLDLATRDDDLWLYPWGVHVDQPTTIGLNVHRSGGTEVVTPTVDFYLDDPITGTLLGSASTPPLAAGINIVGSATISWTPSVTGTATIYAVVDGANLVDETKEGNNSAVAAITVRPPCDTCDHTGNQWGDATPPVVNQFMFQHRIQVTAAPTVTLALTATDNAGDSGMAYMYMVEHIYSSTAHQWVREQETGWMPYTGTHTFQLSPLGGIHYVQAWVGDAAGNIVRTAERAQINYTQANETMLQGQVQVYRYEVAAGETLQALLTATEGDCDLYVWDPQGKLAGYSNNGGTDPDTVPVASPQGGMYQVELRAYTDCVCHLELSTETSQLTASQTAGPATAAGKELPTAPVVATTNLPDDQQAIAAAPPYDSAFLFLPAASR